MNVDSDWRIECQRILSDREIAETERVLAESLLAFYVTEIPESAVSSACAAAREIVPMMRAAQSGHSVPTTPAETENFAARRGADAQFSTRPSDIDDAVRDLMTERFPSFVGTERSPEASLREHYRMAILRMGASGLVQRYGTADPAVREVIAAWHDIRNGVIGDVRCMTYVKPGKKQKIRFPDRMSANSRPGGQMQRVITEAAHVLAAGR